MKTILLLLSCTSLWAEQSIELFVALCDNKTQGIAPVGAKIGNGDDAANNLYWGCSDGARAYFTKSSRWTRESVSQPETEVILESLTFRHKKTGSLLTVHAYRGSEMANCLEDYFKSLKSAGPDKMVAFIGHNGLMDSEPKLPPLSDADLSETPTIILCCFSERYFSPHLKRYQARPLLLTKQLMYSGAFILHDAIEVWLKKGDSAQYLEAAGKAYARNQKISTKAAKGIFVAPVSPPKE